MEIPSNNRIAENIAKIKHIHSKNPKIQVTAAANPSDNHKGKTDIFWMSNHKFTGLENRG